MQHSRNYGIDFLRLLFIYMVCILHVLGQGGVLAACDQGTVSYSVFWLMETISFCAVDGFAFISGYTASNKPQKYEKIVDMWFQAWFYSLIVSLLLSLLGINGGWDRTSIIKRCFPVTFHMFWYFTAYFALFFAVPVLNTFIFTIDEQTSKKAFLILMALFSVMGMLGEPFHTKGGYSALWLIVVYCLGALAKRARLFEKKQTLSLVLLWLLCNLITWGGYVFGGMSRLMNYISPAVLLSAMILVVLFSRIPLKGNVVRKVSPLVFGIYLLQLNPVVWTRLLYNACAFIGSKPLVVGIGYVFFAAGFLFAAGLAVEAVRRKLAQFVKLNVISKKIVALLDGIMRKMFVFLK